MARVQIPVIVVRANTVDEVDLYDEGVDMDDAGDGFYFLNPSGRTVLVALLSPASHAQGTLAVPTIPTATDTMTIGVAPGNKTYTFVATADFNANGEVEIVAGDIAACRTAIAEAINGTDGVNTAHTQVTAEVVGTSVVLTAIDAGVIGNVIVTTETFTAVGNVFDAGRLGTTTAGGEATAADITVKAVPDAYGRGDTDDDELFELENVSGEFRPFVLGRYSPNLFNQSGANVRRVHVDCDNLAGDGKLVAISF